MSENLDDFENLFDELDFEIQDEAPVSDEEKSLIDDSKKAAKPEGEEPVKIKVPASEEDFLNSLEDKDEIEEIDEEDKKETEEDSEEEAEEDDEEDDEKEKLSPSDYFKAVGKGLMGLGKFGDIPEDFEWTEESFLEKFDEMSEQNAKSKIEEILTDGWGETGIQMFNDIFIKKVPVKEYLSAYAEAEDFDSMDLDKVGNQKLVVRTYLESMGVDEDEIYEQIELLEEKDKLADRAEKYKEKLMEDRVAQMQQMAQKREAAIKQQRALESQRFNAISQVVTNALKEKEINGIPLSTSDTNELLRYVTAPAYKLQNGQEITELDKKLIELRRDPAKWVALGKLLKEDLNVGPIKARGEDEKKEKIFEFTKKKSSPTKAGVHDQLDLLFKRK
jgi:hypothetical protein